MRVLIGRASRGGAVAYRPFAEALLGALRAGGPPELPELRPFRLALGRLLPTWSDNPAGPGGARSPTPDLQILGTRADPWPPPDRGGG
jgi:hypothetical protein